MGAASTGRSCQPSSLPTTSAACRSAACITWAYVFSVIAGCAWPSRPAAVRASTPPAKLVTSDVQTMSNNVSRETLRRAIRHSPRSPLLATSAA